MDNTNYAHWRTLMEETYLGAWSLKPGEEKVLTIKDMKSEKVTAQGGVVELCAVAYFTEPGVLPMVLNKTNCDTIEKLYHTGNIFEWVGKKIQIYATTTRFGVKNSVPCLRVRNFIPKTDEVEYRCSVCGKVITKAIHDGSIAKYSKAYCSEECLNKDTKGSDIL